MRKVLDLNTKIILLGKWRSEGIRCLFGQQRACNVPQWSYTIFGTASVSNGSRRGLKEVLTNSLLSNLFQAVFGKEFCKRAPMLRRRTTFSFHCYKPFSFTFWILSKIESANFGFWVVFLWSSLWTWNQNSFKFPSFLELTNSVIAVINFIFDNFPDRSTIIIIISAQRPRRGWGPPTPLPTFLADYIIFFFTLVNQVCLLQKSTSHYFMSNMRTS